MGIITVVAYVIYLGAALLMVFAILLQEGKGGGLSALGGTQAESAFGATNPIRRMTVVLAVVFFLLAGFLSYVGSRERLKIGEERPAAAGTSEEGEGETGAEEEHGHDHDAAADEPAGGGAPGATEGAPEAEAAAPAEPEAKE